MASDLFARIVLQLQDNASKGLESARKHIDGIGQDIDRVKQLAIGFLAFESLKSGAEEIVNLSDRFAALTGKIKQTLGASDDLVTKEQQLFKIAKDTSVGLEGTTQLYTRAYGALKKYGNGQETAAKLTEAVNLSFKAQSSTAAEVESTIGQLTQAIATDAVEWEDFGELADTNLMLVNIAAKNLGYDGIGSLKQAMSDGEVSSTALVAAIIEGFDEIKAAADQMPSAVAAAWTNLKTEFLQYIGLSDQAKDSNRTLADGIGFVTNHLGELITVAVKAGEVLIGVFAANKLKGLALFGQGLVAARTELRATEAAAVTAAASVARAADATARGITAGAAAASTAIATGATAAEASIAVATAAGTAAAASARIQGASVAESIAIAGMAAGKAAMAAGATQAAAAKAAFNVTKQAALEAGATEIQAATSAKAAQRAFNAEVRLTAGAFSEAALAAQAAAARTAASVEAASRRSALALDLVNKALFLPMAAMAAWDVGKWALQFEWVQQSSANAGEKIAKIVAYTKALSNPFSAQSWKELDAEIERIENHFGGVRAKIDGIDKAPPPTAFNKIKQSADSMAEGIDAALTKTKDAAKTHADAMVKPYDDAAKAIAAEFDVQSTQIDADLKNRLYAIDYLAISEKQKIAETTRAVIAAETEKTTAALNTKIKLDKAWEETYGTAIRLARQAGGDISGLEQQGATARIGSLQTVVNAYQSSVDSMINEEHRLLDEVRKTQEERKNFIRSTEDVIRGLKQKGMTDVQAYADRELKIDELKAEAKKALLAGNFTEAKKLSDEIIRLAAAESQAIDQETKDDKGNTKRTEAISKTKVLADSIRDVTEAEQLGKTAMDGLQNSQITQAQNVAGSLDKAKSGLAEFKAELERVQAAFNQSAQLKISIDAQSAQVEINKLSALTAAKELAVKIKAEPINADAEIAALKTTLEAADIKVPAAVKFAELRNEELEKLQNELNVGMAFLQSVPVNVSTTDALKTLEQFKSETDAKLSEPTEAQHSVLPNVDDIYRVIADIKQNTSSTHTIYVQEIQQHANGGPIRFMATGGPVSGPGFRRVTGAISGPGTGTSDEVPIMGSNGEFMMKEAAVSYYGDAFMNAVNNREFPRLPNYATGGPIANSPAAAAPANMSTPQMDTINLVFHFGPKAIPVQTNRSLARDLAVELRSLARAS